MFGSWQIGRLAGIPLKVHFTLLLFIPFLLNRYGTALGGHTFAALLAVVGLLASVALHELGHALTGRRFGCRTREILLTPLGGIAQLDRIPAQPRAELLIALAGPAVSLALAALAGGLTLLFIQLGWQASAWVALALALTNAGLAIFNLLPCFPMDGGRVLRALLTPRWGRLEATRRAVKVGGWLALALGLWGLMQLDLLLVAIAWFVHAAAKAEYRTVLWQESPRPPDPLEMFMRMAMGGLNRPPPPPPPRDDGVEVVVGPPPYRR